MFCPNVNQLNKIIIIISLVNTQKFMLEILLPKLSNKLISNIIHNKYGTFFTYKLPGIKEEPTDVWKIFGG